MFPLPTPATDDDDATQVIDEDTHGSTGGGGGKLIKTRHSDGKQINTDDLCTQVFDIDDCFASSNIANKNNTAKPTDVADDLATQVFDVLTEMAKPLTDKGKKPAKGGARAKQLSTSGVRKDADDENMDNLETQVFDSFVPPAPPGGGTEPLKCEAEVVVTGGRKTRGRMSLKAAYRDTSELTAAKTATVATVSDAGLKADTFHPPTDDLATQVFDADAGSIDISAVPVSSSCLDGVATQTFDDVPVTEGHLKVTLCNLRSDTNAADVETQVFDVDVDPVMNRRNIDSSSTLAQQNIAASEASKGTAAARRSKKSLGRRKRTESTSGAEGIDDIATQVFDPEPQENMSKTSKISVRRKQPESMSAAGVMDDVATQVFDLEPRETLSKNSKISVESKQTGSSFVADVAAGGMDDLATQVFDLAPQEKPSKNRKMSIGRKQTKSSSVADGIDDVATQVFDLEPRENPSKNSKITGPDLSSRGEDGSDVGAGKSRRSRAKVGNRSETVQDEEQDIEESTTRDDTSKSRRLSSRANKGKHSAKEAALPAVPEDSDVDKPKAARSQRKQTRPSAVDDSSRSPVDIQLPSRDVDESKASSSAASDVGKAKAARSQGKRAKQMPASGPGDSSEPPVGVEALYTKVGGKGSAKLSERHQRKSKNETGQTGKSGKAAKHAAAAELTTDDTDDDEEDEDAANVAKKTLAKQAGKKTKKLYTPIGLYCLFVLLCLLIPFLQEHRLPTVTHHTT